MLRKLVKWFNEGSEEPLHEAPKDAIGKWGLMFESILIGELSVSNGEWIFEYSNSYKQRDDLNLLIDFPDKKKIYKSKHLWPFFAHRIPGLGQPKVQKIIQKEHLDKNEVDLLKRFGRWSITNPFELKTLPDK
jgi:HipA-like protein